MTEFNVDRQALLLSVKPKYANLIVDRKKTIELRRRVPRIHKGAEVFIYSTSPEKALIGGATISEVRTIRPDWELARYLQIETRVTESKFREYFKGATRAVLVELRRAFKTANPIPLNVLRDNWPNWNPPQSYGYLSLEQLQAVTQLGYYRQSGQHENT